MAERRPRKTAPRVTVPEKLTPKDRAEFAAHQAQAEAEGVELDEKVDFMGAQFKMADKIGLWPLIAFSMAQKRGDNVDPASLATIGVMVLDCLDKEEHERFGAHATEAKAGAEELMTLVQQVIEVVSARPTRPPGDSSAGRPTTSANSKELSLTEGMVSPADVGR
jgi:hypothetical protein